MVRLGYLRHLLGEHDEAARAFHEALDIYLELGSLVGEANTLVYLGATRTAVGQHANAVDMLHRAQNIYTSLGNERGQAMALMYTAEAMHDGGDREEAARALAQATDIFQAAGDTLNEAHALTLKGAFAFTEGAFDRALAHYRHAWTLASRTRRRATEAIALRGMGSAAAANGDMTEGIECLEAALEIYRSLGSPIAEAVETELIAHRFLLTPAERAAG